MSLKDQTKEKHTLAERTLFMNKVLKNMLPKDLWADWTYQKTLFYNAIEGCAAQCGLLNDLPGVQRTLHLYQDFLEMWDKDTTPPAYRPVVLDYYNYLLSIGSEPEKVMAHLYVWHMGDLFGGQMIKKIVTGVPHRNLEFADPDNLKNAIRAKLTDSMGNEANTAFDWAIRMMQDYDAELI